MSLRNLMLAALLAAQPAATLAQEVVKPVKLMTVEASEYGLQRTFFGQVVARQTVDLAFQVAGQIIAFPVIEGDQLRKGDLIARLDPETFDLALDQARLRKEQADRDVERLRQLTGTAVSKVTLEDAITEAALADVALRNAEYGVKHAVLHAPFDALIASRSVANFTTIAAGTPVVRLHDMSELRIEIDVPEVLFQEAGKHPGARSELFAQFPFDDRLYPLEIREFNAEASTIGQTFRLTLALANGNAVDVLPGSSTSVIARPRNDRGEVTVPTSALKAGDDGTTHVMLFEATDGDLGTLRQQPVTVTPTASGGFAVTQGLEPGDEIVVAGVAALTDGQVVRRFAGFPN